MTGRLCGNVMLTAFLLVSYLGAQIPSQTPSSAVVPENSSAFGKRERSYTMNVSVELIPLILHPSWKNVGGGRIGWIEGPDGEKGLELLIGSDPARTPRKINRWGFISEHVSGSSARLIGIMTQSDEQSVEQAKASVEKSAKGHVFKAIRSLLNDGEAHSFTTPLPQAENYTYKDVALLLSKIPESGSSVRQVRIPDNTDSGFLFSVRELINESVDNYCRSHNLHGTRPRRYVYNASLFDLSIVKSTLLKRENVNGKEYQGLIESEFKALNRATNKASSFTVTYGIDGQFFKIPVRIAYNPRWWFQAELLLDESVKAVQTAQKAGGQ
jgi:hypothetical protein